MAAYLIGQIEVTDPETYEEYKQQVSATFAPYGAKFLARGGAIEVLEGESLPRMVIVEFPSVEQAKAWYNSPEYAGPKALRQAASISNQILVEGV